MVVPTQTGMEVPGGCPHLTKNGGAKVMIHALPGLEVQGSWFLHFKNWRCQDGGPYTANTVGAREVVRTLTGLKVPG